MSNSLNADKLSIKEIENYLAKRKAKELTEMKAEFNEKLQDLKALGESIQIYEPTFSCPWDSTTSPAKDQRHYQFKNIYDAILKVLPNGQRVVNSKYIYGSMKTLGLTYKQGTVNCSLSYFGGDWNDSLNEYVPRVSPYKTLRGVIRRYWDMDHGSYFYWKSAN